MKTPRAPILVFFALAFAFALRIAGADFTVFDTSATVGSTHARILFSDTDAKVVSIAARDLASDIELVSGRKPEVAPLPESGTPPPAILIGTLGHSPLIDALAASGKLDVSAVRGQWETFVIATVGDALVIAGSDKRGTAYGVYELSRMMGVSPWAWWADVVPEKKTRFTVPEGSRIVGPPSVKYRGIFINDEDWGLEPWASKTFDPETGNIGPKTYARIFEVMLRMRANYIWPGMHPTTTPFHQMPGNAAGADDYAIFVGSSHAEPMHLNNGKEWKAPKEQFNYLTNREGVLAYWENRVSSRTAGDNIFTIGMRGINDSPIIGPKTQAERIATLEKVFADQRALIARHLGGGDPARVPQIFCPYKEVLSDYEAGLRVPDDVILVWPDDNYGYIRRYATPAERARSGGLGVYYHASYSGMPQSWLWVDTQPPALVWAEMTRAYEQGARALWILNVGDLKNTERSTEFFLDLAWNADRTDVNAPARFIRETAARDFGEKYADAVADILTRMQALSFERRAEHLQWHLSLTAYKPTEFNEAEMNNRLKKCAALLSDSDALSARLPAHLRDAYYQLVGYPVAIIASTSQRYFHSELARADIARGRSPDANIAASEEGQKRIIDFTAKYNNEISGGKWRHIVNENGYTPKAWPRFQRDRTTPRPPPTLENVAPPAPPPLEPLPHPAGARAGDFVERNGVVAINAGNFSAKTDMLGGTGWRAIPGLGRSGSAVTVMPSTAAISANAAPSLSYRFHVATAGADAELHVRLLPTFPLVSGENLRLAVSIDDSAPIPLTVTEGFDTTTSPTVMTAWQKRVLSNATETSTKLPAPLALGWHTLRLIAVDAGVVVDKIVLDLGGLQPSYDGPAETRITDVAVAASAVIDVWPENKMPGRGASEPETERPSNDGFHRITNISHPTLTMFPAVLPSTKSGKPAPAMIVCPGGGYSYVVVDKEGAEIAAWLNTQGITAFVLKYRTPNNRAGAIQDLQRALSVLRARADEWNIDPRQIGVIGFSAGGNLAAKANTLFDTRTYPAIDAVDSQSCRPDFAVLVYPAYLDDKKGRVSSDLNLKAHIPPTLIVHSEDDKTHVVGSKLYAAALTDAKIPHQFLLYKTGGHGYGLRCKREAKVWPQSAAAWLETIFDQQAK